MFKVLRMTYLSPPICYEGSSIWLRIAEILRGSLFLQLPTTLINKYLKKTGRRPSALLITNKLYAKNEGQRGIA